MNRMKIGITKDERAGQEKEKKHYQDVNVKGLLYYISLTVFNVNVLYCSFTCISFSFTSMFLKKEVRAQPNPKQVSFLYYTKKIK